MDTAYSLGQPWESGRLAVFFDVWDRSSCSSMPAVVRCAVDRRPIEGTVLARVGGRPRIAEVPYLLADDH